MDLLQIDVIDLFKLLFAIVETYVMGIPVKDEDIINISEYPDHMRKLLIEFKPKIETLTKIFPENTKEINFLTMDKTGIYVYCKTEETTLKYL